jgi:hypothetical protein
MTLFDRNVQILTLNPSHWIGSLDEHLLTHQFVEKDEDGTDYFLTVDQKVIAIKDEFDPEQKPNSLKRELVFAIGVHSINELTQLYQNMSKESVLIIVEPNISFFYHSLHYKDMSLFKFSNVLLFTDDLMNFKVFLERVFSTSLIYLAKNIRFYLTNYYRKYDIEKCREIINQIRETIKYKAMAYGNSVEDSLTGLKHNLQNMKQLLRSKDVSKLKNVFQGKPAVIVAAGPSLNKNINQLKQIKNRAVVIAVDTIADRLIKEGIIPDFVCSIEREKETYTYFYEGKYFPKETTLVGPLLLYPKIFEEFPGDIAIPMRHNVGEYIWLRDILGLSSDSEFSMGLSCAHVAFGFAVHIGASPIILVGQDLAFGSSKEQSHAGGTIYDDKNFVQQVFSNIETVEVEGYYGQKVLSTRTWVNFKKWFENEIIQKDLFVINATEGGARIENTIQKPLAEAIEEYCQTEIGSAKDLLNTVPNYPIEKEQVYNVLLKERDMLKELHQLFKKQLEKVQKIKIYDSFNEKDLLAVLKRLQKTDSLFGKIQQHWLLRHNLQPVIVTTLWKLYDIEQVLSVETMRRNKEIQIEFLTVSVFVMDKIVELLDECVKSL